MLYRWIDADVNIGVPELPPLRDNQGALTGRIVIDRLDNPYIPRDGVAAQLVVIAPLEELGADDDYARIHLEILGFGSVGRHTVFAGVRGVDSFGGEPASYDYAKLGGFLNLGGYAPGQLFDRASFLAQAGYYYELKELLAVLGRAVYVGGVLEAGGAGSDLSGAFEDPVLSVTALLAVDTNFGPIFVAVASGEGGGAKIYLAIGRSF